MAIHSSVGLPVSCEQNAALSARHAAKAFTDLSGIANIDSPSQLRAAKLFATLFCSKFNDCFLGALGADASKLALPSANKTHESKEAVPRVGFASLRTSVRSLTGKLRKRLSLAGESDRHVYRDGPMQVLLNGEWLKCRILVTNLIIAVYTPPKVCVCHSCR